MSTVKEPEVLEREIVAGLSSLEQQTRGEIDVQISTAKRFPRSIQTFKDQALAMATLDADTAASCIYALPRKEQGSTKNIEGPSARFAEICASAWGHMRVESRPVGEDDRFVTTRSVAWDLQQNVAIAFEVKRRITNRSGAKFNDDMVSVTSNAAGSIGIRNSVLKVIPSPLWRPIYLACRKVIAGDLKTLVNRRATMFELFQKIGVTKEQVLQLIDVKGPDDIGIDELVTLHGMYNSLKDGETTIAEIFGDKEGAREVKPAQRKSQQQDTSNGSTAEAGPTLTASGEAAPQGPANTSSTSGSSTPSAAATSAPKNVGVIVDVSERGNAVLIKLDTGFTCATGNGEFMQAAVRCRDNKTRVELVTRPHAKGGTFAPQLEEIQPVEA